MNKNIEFVTSKKQYLFSALVKNVEILAVGALAAAVMSMFFNGNDSFQITRTLFTFIFMLIAVLIFTALYAKVKLGLFKSELPKIIISDMGIYLDELGVVRKIKWSEITKVEVKGKFRKVIVLNEAKLSVKHEIEYYLFSPEQRRKIISTISSRIASTSR